MDSIFSRLFFVLLGHTFIALATIGVFLPVVPTTPFVLAASACYARSSKRFHTFLEQSRVFGPILRNWEENRSISTRAKYVSVVTLIVVMSVSFFLTPRVAPRIVLVVIGLSVSAYILTRPAPQRW